MLRWGVYTETAKRIPELIASLDSVETRFSYEKKCIGEAISMLRLLKDIIGDSDEG